ncbi:MAG: phosphoribosyl-AMP cyclohydrolase [Parvibaculales bacterium]
MSINEADLARARQAWGDALVSISKAYETTGIEEASAVAGNVLDTLYGYAMGPVLFKPTLSGGAQTFRPTRQGALSYFVGHNPEYPQDGGFGLKYWRDFSSETSAIFMEENIAMWMGWVTLTDKDGDMVKVDKSWGYRKDADGALKIVLHHSSIPYTA